MKRSWTFLLAAGLLLAVPTTLFTSCGDDDPTEVPGGGDVEDNGGTVDDVKLTPNQSKSRMETVAKNLMNEVDSRYFSSLSNLCNDLSSSIKDMDNENVSDWAQDLLESMTMQTGNPIEETYYSRYTYDRLIVLSQFHGRFTAKNGQWKYDKTLTNLEFVINDASGNSCTLSVTPSGNTKKVYMGESWYGSDSYVGNGHYKWEEDVYSNYVMVPEHILVKLTQGNNTRTEVNINIDLSQFTEPEYDLSKDGVSTKASLKVEDYVLTINRVNHSGSEGSAEVNGNMTKSGKMLIEFSAKASNTKFDAHNELATGGPAEAYVNILGQMQLRGTCSNVKSFVDYLDKASKVSEETNGSAYKNYINQANQQLNAGIYFDNGKTQQAFVKLMSFKEEYNGGRYVYWYNEPGIYFDDNTSYVMGDYFNRDNFGSVVDLFERLLQGYEDLFDY